MFRESETVELKAIVVEDIKKEIVAFANSAGGMLYLGVADDGSVLGIEHPDTAVQQLSTMIRDGIKPDVTLFVNYKILDQAGKMIVAVEVQRGSERPYYLAKKGLRPAGVYVRQGTSSAPASDTAIRQMIKETDGDSFEDMRSLIQELTFDVTATEFAKRGVTFGTAQMKTLGMVNAEGIFTNLGLLLSEQCSHTIKAAVFEGEDQGIFRDRREFTGSLLSQLNQAYDYIDIHNKKLAVFDKLRRIDKRDYPEAAIREALLNALVHRNYSYGSSTLISIFSNRIELTSIGGLLPGFTLDDIMLGISVCRNPKLANVFYRLELIETYGTGIVKMFSAYEGSNAEPEIITANNAFKIILPNINEEVHFIRESPAVYGVSGEISERDVLALASRKAAITRKDIEEASGLKQTAAGRVLAKMVERGLLEKKGRGRNTRYVLKKKNIKS